MTGICKGLPKGIILSAQLVNKFINNSLLTLSSMDTLTRMRATGTRVSDSSDLGKVMKTFKTQIEVNPF